MRVRLTTSFRPPAVSTVTRHCGTVALLTSSSEAFRWKVKRTVGGGSAVLPVLFATLVYERFPAVRLKVQVR